MRKTSEFRNGFHDASDQMKVPEVPICYEAGSCFSAFDHRDPSSNPFQKPSTSKQTFLWGSGSMIEF